MEKLKVCRICLITDVRMYDLQSYPFKHYSLNNIGIDLYSFPLPSYACFECAALIKKYHFFREKCQRGQGVLLDTLRSFGEISVHTVAQIDRQSLKLASSINLKSHLSVHTGCCFVDEENIKNEPLNDSLINNESNDKKYELEVIKEEVSFDDIAMSNHYSSDDDDEPLSLHKEKKQRKKSEKKRGRKRKEEKEKEEKQVVKVEGVEASEDVSDLLPILDKATEKKKRGRPRKASEGSAQKEGEQKRRRTQHTGGVDPEDIDLEEYVTVINLSLEEQMEEVVRRQHSSNFQNAAFQCGLCYRGFIDTDAWKHHLGKHDPSSGDIECPVCKFRFKTNRTLQKHAANHQKKYACKSCSYVSKTTTQAKQHQRWHKGVTYKCQYCDEVSTKWTSYLSHVRIKHPSEFVCDVCGYSYVSKLGLSMHRTMMHKDVPDPIFRRSCMRHGHGRTAPKYRILTNKQESKPDGSSTEPGPYCAECNVKFVSEEAYKRHMVTSVKHIKHNNFKNGCRVCGSAFATAEELRLHHRREHARKRPRNYGKKPSALTFPTNCDHCSEEMSNARQYWAHFRRVHPDKNYPIQKDYVCDVCGKSFRGNAFLVYHKRTHQEERNYKCSQCPKAFFNRTNLLMHEKTHSDTRPYPCSVCFKAFKCKGALDRHFRSHTGVKPYECEVCGKAFGQSNSRKLHVRTVHLKQPAPYVSRARLERRNKAAKETPAIFMY